MEDDDEDEDNNNVDVSGGKRGAPDGGHEEDVCRKRRSDEDCWREVLLVAVKTYRSPEEVLTLMRYVDSRLHRVPPQSTPNP